MLNLKSNLEWTLLLEKEPTSISHLVYIRWQSLNGSRLWPLMENIFFFQSNVLMRKCWVLIMASSCWWPILRFILIGRFNLVCLVLTELMNCVLRQRFVTDLTVEMTFPLHGLKSIDLTKTLFPIQCTNGKMFSSGHGIQ